MDRPEHDDDDDAKHDDGDAKHGDDDRDDDRDDDGAEHDGDDERDEQRHNAHNRTAEAALDQGVIATRWVALIGGEYNPNLDVGLVVAAPPQTPASNPPTSTPPTSNPPTTVPPTATVPPGDLPLTGSSSSTLLVVATACIALGYGTVGWRKRRTNSVAAEAS